MSRALALPLVALLLIPIATASFEAAPDAPRKLITVIDPLAMPTHLPVPVPGNGIGPGSNLFIDMEDGFLYGCTANFLWRSTTGKTYLGAAGHCFLPAGTTATHGPGADYDPSHTHVQVCMSGCSFGGQASFFITGNLVDLGPVVYARQTGPGGDVGNDFGLVEIPAALLAQTRASMPVWGGPTSATPANANGPVCMYGNGVLVGEVYPTMARAGVGLGSFDDGSWQIGIASEVGDSGSAVITCQNDAGGVHGVRPVGVLTHGIGAVVVTVPALAFGTTTEKAIEMARQAGLTISVIPGA